MKKRLLIATTNPGKVREIREILAGAPVALVGLDELPAIPEPEETGTSFRANAHIKAEAAARATSLPAFSDDSGLVVEALDAGDAIDSALAAPTKQLTVHYWRKVFGPSFPE